MKFQIINVESSLWMQVLHQLDHDFYHLPGFLDLEASRLQAVAEAIIIQDYENIFFLPYLVRTWDGSSSQKSGWDVVSPYGYPGFLIRAIDRKSEFIRRAMLHLCQVWQERQICSAFLRLHPILNTGIEQDLAGNSALKVRGQTASIDLSPSLDVLWKQTRENHRRGINRLRKAGFSTVMLPFTEANLDSFMGIYKETMDRVNAKPLYYFEQEYFVQLSHALESIIYLCVVHLNQDIVAGALITECNGIVQYHLGGTHNDFLKEAPMKMIFDYVRSWAKGRNNHTFHLGGGVGALQDSLYNFKLGFANQIHTFSTLHLIVNPTQYLSWVTDQAKQHRQTPGQLLESSFFPAYRVIS